MLLGDSRGYLWLMLGCLVVAFFGHVTGIVAYTVTATSGLPDDEQGLATGLSTLTQQVGITLGIPILSTVATARTNALSSSPGSRRSSAASTPPSPSTSQPPWWAPP